ncbi:MAG TPA: hypothetical protein VJ765_16030 [Chitinophagaceae bacterium]|nr:hypothetical protein [Chitinophagaceae bacterium]
MPKIFIEKKYIVLVLLSAINLAAFAQRKIPEFLQQKLAGKTKFYDIRADVLKFFGEERAKISPSDAKKLKALNRQLKFWNRWFEESEGRLDEKGEVVNAAQKIFEVSNSLQEINAPSAYGNWSSLGPNYVEQGIGRAICIAFHPTDPNIVYVGTAAGGLWKATFLGSTYTWQPLSDHIPSMGVSGIVVSHSNPNHIYILTGEGDGYISRGFTFTFGYVRYSVGVLKSTDGGNTWNQTASFPGVSSIRYVGFKLIQDPNNANVLFAATSNGIFKTSNGGNSWVRPDMRSTDGSVQYQNDTTCYDIEFRPGSSSVLYAAYNFVNSDGTNNGAGVFTSTDGGEIFYRKTLSGLFSLANRIALAVTPANPDFVYAICGPGFLEEDGGEDKFNGLFLSINSGQNFSKQIDEPDVLAYVDIINTFENQSMYDLALAASSANANVVLMGGLVVWRSSTAGIGLTEVVDYFSDIDNSNYIHPDVHALEYNPLNGRLFAATDGGIAYSNDNGTNWVQMFNGLSISQFYHFEPSDEDGAIWGGTQDNGVLIQLNGGANFNQYSGGDGYDVLTDKVGNNDDSYYVVNDNIYDDALIGLDNITPDGETEFFPLLGMHSTDEDILYAGYSNSLYISFNRGSDWSDRGVSAKWALSNCPSNGNRVYCAGSASSTERGIWRIDNILLSNFITTDLTPSLLTAGYPGFQKITDIAVNPSNSNQVWISIGGFVAGAKVFYSADAGLTWINRSGSLPNLPANSIITDAAGSTYVGTDIGVYYRNNAMSDWTPFYNDFPRVPVSELAFIDIFNPLDPPNPLRYIYASTFGRGIWRSEIFSSCTNSLSIAENLQGQQFFQAANDITSTSLVDAGAGTNVSFQSGNNITLTPGFEAIGGTVFHSYIRGCNTGPLPLDRAAMLDEQNKKMINSDGQTFGKIVGVPVSDENANVKLKINTEASYTLQLMDENGRVISQFIVDKLLNGASEEMISLKDIPKGFYHLQLWYGERIVHFQELNW